MQRLIDELFDGIALLASVDGIGERANTCLIARQMYKCKIYVR
jgi:hypothetical protein